jgi:putative oxidoreductase
MWWAVVCHHAIGDNAMDRYSRNTVVLARVLMSVIFLLNGLGIVDQTMATKELAATGLPAALVPLMMLGARTLEVVAGLALALGIYPQWAAVALLVFLVPTTFVAHAFWSAAGTPRFTGQLVNFLKNICMWGGLLFVAATSNRPRMFPRTESTPGGERPSR